MICIQIAFDYHIFRANQYCRYITMIYKDFNNHGIFRHISEYMYSNRSKRKEDSCLAFLYYSRKHWKLFSISMNIYFVSTHSKQVVIYFDLLWLTVMGWYLLNLYFAHDFLSFTTICINLFRASKMNIHVTRISFWNLDI